ncbi:MAG: NADP transhydrogenase subunit alpha [Halobacteriovorax sp.]|nr:NADP transhydrogenase subunit alpha [Halobacteriovorax sp.]
MKKKLAIVGTGISGMSAAYFLKDHYEITVFEKNNYIGGHTNTVTVDGVAIDTGFIVFNYSTYPNLVKLFNQIGIKDVDTDMSFAVRDDGENLEYCGSGFNGLFGQRSNILSKKFWSMLFEINRFNSEALEVLEDDKYALMTIGDYLGEKNYSPFMVDKYLVPCASAIWSTSPKRMKEFPIKTLVRFFKNHGLLGLNGHHQWKTVPGGSWKYRDKLISSFRDKIKVGEGVEETFQKDGKHIIKTKLSEYEFDKVVFASHADQTLRMIKDKTSIEEELLPLFPYEKNIAQLHTDLSVMPKRKRNWSAWNYFVTDDPEQKCVTTYHMNTLQPLGTDVNYFVTLNGENFVDSSKVIKRIEYDHPSFDFNAVKSQERLPLLNKQDNGRYFCGAWFRYGFHEDGLLSSINMCKEILGVDEVL